jgi:hypothetical protein
MKLSFVVDEMRRAAEDSRAGLACIALAIPARTG